MDSRSQEERLDIVSAAVSGAAEAVGPSSLRPRESVRGPRLSGPAGPLPHDEPHERPGVRLGQCVYRYAKTRWHET